MSSNFYRHLRIPIDNLNCFVILPADDIISIISRQAVFRRGKGESNGI